MRERPWGTKEINGKKYAYKQTTVGEAIVPLVAPYYWTAKVEGDMTMGEAESFLLAKRQARRAITQLAAGPTLDLSGPPVTKELQQVFGCMGRVKGVIVWPSNPTDIIVSYTNGSFVIFAPKEMSSMTEKTVNTICGPFNRVRYDSLCQTLDAAEKEGLDKDQTIKFEGQDLLISFGQHLRTFLDATFAQRGHNGL